MLKRISKALYYPGPDTFQFRGSPAQFRGPNHELTASYVSTFGATGEPVKVHCIPCYVSVVYLVEYVSRKKFVLFDTGVPTDFKRVEFYMNHVLNRTREESARVSLQGNLDLLVISHSHFDHCGAAGTYHEKGVPVVRPTGAESSYTGITRRWNMLAEIIALDAMRMVYKRKREDPFVCSQGWLGPYWEFLPPAVKLLEDGDTLPRGFEDWVAIRIPGHTTHMMGFYHPPSRLFYSADLTVRVKKGFFPSMPMNYQWAYLHTIDRLRKLDVGIALLAHGGPIDVESEAGSWNALLDNLKQNLLDEYDVAVRKRTTKGRGAAGLIKSMLNFYPAEARPFSKEDLDNGPLPVGWKDPQPCRIDTSKNV